MITVKFSDHFRLTHISLYYGYKDIKRGTDLSSRHNYVIKNGQTNSLVQSQSERPWFDHRKLIFLTVHLPTFNRQKTGFLCRGPLFTRCLSRVIGFFGRRTHIPVFQWLSYVHFWSDSESVLKRRFTFSLSEILGCYKSNV